MQPIKLLIVEQLLCLSLKVKLKVSLAISSFETDDFDLDYWLDANVKADFDKSERYLLEFFNHKNYYKFKKMYFEQLHVIESENSSMKVKKVQIGAHDPCRKVKF